MSACRAFALGCAIAALGTVAAKLLSLNSWSASGLIFVGFVVGRWWGWKGRG